MASERNPATAFGLWRELSGVPLSQRYVLAGDVRTRVLEAGSPNSPHLLLLHGADGDADIFLRALGGLSEGFHVVACDLAGYGWSEVPTTPFTIDAHALHIEATLDALGIARCFMVGESLGAWVAVWLATHQPDRVDGLLLEVPLDDSPGLGGERLLLEWSPGSQIVPLGRVPRWSKWERPGEFEGMIRGVLRRSE